MKKLLAGVIIAVAVMVALPVTIAVKGLPSFDFTGSIPKNIMPSEQDRDVRLAQQVHEEVNKERTVVDLKPLAWNQDAADKAQVWAKHLYDTNTFEHSTTFCHGENIVNMKGSFTAEEAVNTWMNSHEHRDNIRQPAYTSEGIGVYGGIVVENFC